MFRSPTAKSDKEAGQKPASLEDFHNLHLGETCILVGNSNGLHSLPVDFLHKYPSIAGNTIFLHAQFRPTYYTAVDRRVYEEFSEQINELYSDIPKFLPTPNLDDWKGENIYRWYHRQGSLWPANQERIWPRSLLGADGITYTVIMHVIMQLAHFMGFSRMLMVGVSHNYPRQHFWGVDEGMANVDAAEHWAAAERGYKELYEGFGKEIINLTPDTRVAAIPRGDWKNFA